MVTRISPMPPQHKMQGSRKPDEDLLKVNASALLQKGPSRRENISNFSKEYDLNDDNNVEQLANQLITSTVIKCKENSGVNEKKTSVNLAREFHKDETDKRLFDIEGTYENDYNFSFPLPPNEQSQNNDARLVNDSFVLAYNQGFLSSDAVGLDTRKSRNTETMKKIQRGEHGIQAKPYRPNTPPLTLYSNEGIPPPTLSSGLSIDKKKKVGGDNSDIESNYMPIKVKDITDECAVNYLSPSFSIENNTPTSTPNLNSISNRHVIVGSLISPASSRGSLSTAASSLIKQPVLYSAIGSLEHVNNNSLTNLNKRFLAPSKEFCKPGGSNTSSSSISSILIAPARPSHNGQEKRFISHTNSGVETEISRPDINAVEQKDQHLYNTIDENVSLDLQENNYRNNPEDADPWIETGLPQDKSFARDHNRRRQTIPGSAPNDANKIEIKSRSENGKIRIDTQTNNRRKSKSNKKVSYDANAKTRRSKSKTVEMFRPSSDAYTPRIERKKIKYKTAEARPSVQHMSSPMGTLQRPNFRDALRRVAMIIHQHIVKIESRFEQKGGEFGGAQTRLRSATNDGLFHASMRDMFNEDLYRTPTYKCHMARIPMARSGMVYGLRKIKIMYSIPSEAEIYEFGHQLFKSVQLSSECSIVCLIYVERLMEVAKVPLLACTWRPIFMCGLLLASKVWQDLSSWNIEFSSVYPQFSLEAINKLEANFLCSVKWDLYISSSSYAKYYFALRSLVEKKDFRQRYNRMVGGVGNVAQAEALKVQERTERVKEEALLQLSRSM